MEKIRDLLYWLERKWFRYDPRDYEGMSQFDIVALRHPNDPLVLRAKARGELLRREFEGERTHDA
jgi:hypothetical protein